MIFGWFCLLDCNKIFDFLLGLCIQREGFAENWSRVTNESKHCYFFLVFGDMNGHSQFKEKSESLRTSGHF